MLDECPCPQGRFDFVADAKLIRPDIYFVCDDASKLDERMSLFEKVQADDVMTYTLCACIFSVSSW